MVPSSIKRINVILVLAIAVACPAVWSTAAAPARAASPSITAIVDSQKYGVLVIAGQGFTPRTTATIQIREATSGTLLGTAPAKVNTLGSFTGTASFTVAAGAPLLDRVAIRAIDDSQATTDDLLVTLSPPVTLVRAHLAGVQQALIDAQAAVNHWIGSAAQAREQLAAAQQALAAALNSGAPAGVIQQLQAALVAASQQYAAAEQELTAANATVDQLLAEAGGLQQDLNQG